MKSSVFIITGGTGGHVIPAVNFFNYIDSKTENVYLLTDKRGSKYIQNINPELKLNYNLTVSPGAPSNVAGIFCIL